MFEAGITRADFRPSLGDRACTVDEGAERDMAKRAWHLLPQTLGAAHGARKSPSARRIYPGDRPDQAFMGLLE
jgi:hypothetical protein